MPLKVGLHNVSTLAQFNDLAATASAENKRLVAVLGERGYTIRVVSGHNFLTKLAANITGQTDRENLRLENFRNGLTGTQTPAGAPTLLQRQASTASLSGTSALETQSIDQDYDESEDDQGISSPLRDLNELLASALQNADSAQSQATIRSILATCMELRRDTEGFTQIAQMASVKEELGSSHHQFNAHLLLNDLEKNFKQLSASIDFSPGLKQEFNMYQPIIGDVLEIIGSHLSRLNQERGSIQRLHDDLSFHGLTMLKPADGSQSSAKGALTIDLSRIEPRSELGDLLSRVKDAGNAYVFESALARIDHKIEELTHVTQLIKASARRHEPYVQMFEGSIASWEFSAKTLQEIRDRLSEAYQVKFPSQWQGSDTARFCGELIHSGPQICADLMMQVINPPTRGGKSNPAGVSASLIEQAPLLAQFLAECPTESSILLQGRSDLVRSGNCLGTLQAKINAAGQHLIAYRNHLSSSTGNSRAMVKEYDEAISRLATLNVLLVMKTNQAVQNLNTIGQYDRALNKWTEKLRGEMNEVQDLCHSLLNASPAPTVVFKSLDSRLNPVIARANGNYEIGVSSERTTFIGENPTNLGWEFSVAKAWRSARASDYSDNDFADQLQSGMDFLVALKAPEIPTTASS